jgi:hypothetical protein
VYFFEFIQSKTRINNLSILLTSQISDIFRQIPLKEMIIESHQITKMFTIENFIKKNSVTIYRVSQNWRRNYLLPYRRCLNVHEKNMEKMFPTKNQLFLLLLLTVIQCKQKYIRTSLPCIVTVVDLKHFFRFPKLLNSLLCRIQYW